MLGSTIEDSQGVEGGRRASAAGLGLLDHHTVMSTTKTIERVNLEAFGRTYPGYEIRYGELSGGGRFVTQGGVTATTVHGLFEQPRFLEDLLGVQAEHVLESTFELLADTVEAHLDAGWLRSLLEVSVNE